MRMMKILAAMTLAITSWSAECGPFYANKDGGMVWDQATGQVWMRCSLGQRWDGKSCSGTAELVGYGQASKVVETFNAAGGFGGFNDWGLPSSKSLQSLVLCSQGKSETFANGGHRRCTSEAAVPTIDPGVFPRTAPVMYETSTQPMVVNFSWGGTGAYIPRQMEKKLAMRLARRTSVSPTEAESLFPVLIAGADERGWAVAREAVLKEQAAREAEEEAEQRRSKAEQELAQRREAAERRAELKKQLAKGGQGLYLEAAQKQRSGDTSEATRLYELIIEHFPKDPLAVKAADQLTAMSRSSQSDTSNRSSSQQSCQAQKASCFASCPAYVPTTVRSNPTLNDAHFNCKSRCEAVSCN